ncbi:MAG: hypothetical protein ABIN04_17200 [Ginsengibacter sp.]
MKKISIIIISNFFFLLNSFGQNKAIAFKSSDTAMQNAFNEAKAMALHYKGKPGDPVGPWYEAALPGRDAFCMRDISHQCIGAEILGLSKENKNMFTLFAKNISKSKDWCSYWEINKYGKPAPVDYKNDKEFWYNLNANFDLLYACLRLYLWTGDKTYINSPVFKNFYEKSTNEYIDKWVLHADSLLLRPAHPNALEPFNFEKFDKYRRGLESYYEDITNLKMGIDLVAAIYRGLMSYSHILKLNGDTEKAEYYEKKAQPYQQKIEQDWWDNTDSLYKSYYTWDGKFGKGNAEVFLLWFDALKDSMRTRKTIENLISEDSKIERESYLPVILYKYGFWKQAYDHTIHLASPTTKRREYPEASYAAIEGIVQGLMGIEPDAENNRVTTFYRSQNGKISELDNLPVLNTFISIKHESKKTYFYNEGKLPVNWRAVFAGKYEFIIVNDKKNLAKTMKDKSGNLVSYIDTMVGAGKKMNAFCRN